MVIFEDTIPVKYWVSQATDMVGQNFGNISRVLEQDMESKVVKIALISETIRRNNPDAVNQNCQLRVGISRKLAEKVIQETTN